MLVICTNAAFAQVNNKLSPAFRYLIANSLNAETAIPELYKVPSVAIYNEATGIYESKYMCIIYTKNSAALTNRGIVLQSVLPTFATAAVTLQQIIQLSEMIDVSYIDAPRMIFPNNDISVGSSGASLLQAGRLNNTIYKGDGVIVGVFDTGIDWKHPDFRNASDQTKSRILKIWDQTITPITGEVSPTGFNYGVEYTQAQLNDELDGTPTNYVREKDLNGHGTHVAGTAAGNGAALTTGKYAGIAPNADIVMVKGGNGSFSTTDIINALTYFKNVATALGKPIVVNMSIGGQSGAHDGTNAEEVAVDNFSNSAAGRVVAIAAGNDNGTAIHKQTLLAANGSNTITINVPTASGSTATDVFEFTMYANNASAVNATITMPGGTTVTANAGQSISPSVLSNAATVYLDNVVDAASGLRNITLYVVRNTTSANPSGTWIITLNNATATALTVDGWLDYKGANFSNTTVSSGDNNYLVGSPGTATTAVTVASYMAKLDWYSTSTTAAGGYAYSLGQQDNISTFSSVGPRRDNVQKPDITANGQAVVSCLASDAGIAASSNTIVVQGLYRAIQGTSMATPEVAGCIALLLQVKPTATFSQIRNAITTTATKDGFTGASTNATWGSGKIDVFKAASSLLFCKPSTRITYSYDSSTTNANNSTLSLSAAKVATRFTPTINGKLGGVYFKTGTTVTLTSFTIEVRTNSSNTPGTLLGSMSVTPSSVSRFSWNYYDVSALNISVANGTDYFIVLVPGSSDSWALGYEALSVSGRSFTNSGSSWVAANDLRIRTVVYDNTLPSTSSTTNVSICSNQLPYSWNAQSFANAGSYVVHLTNSIGCDSAATLNLTTKNISSSTTNVSICSSQLPYSWNAQSFTVAGSYVVHLTNAGGCDSAATLNLIVKQPTFSTTSTAINSNQLPYNWNGQSFAAAGSYVVHLLNSVGCDSAATLNLSINAPTTLTISGPNAVCVGSTITLSANISGGVWSTPSSSLLAVVANTGVVSGLNASVGVITYKVNGLAANYTITVNPKPNVPTMQYAPGTPDPQTGAGAGAFCNNKTFTVVGSPSGGIWKNTGIAITVDSILGVVNTIATGAFSITYTYKDIKGCSNSRTVSASVVNCASHKGLNIEQAAKSSSEFTLYPNPARSTVSLEVKKLVGAGSIVVTDLYGKQVKTQSLSMGTNTIDISNLGKGFYLVSTITEQGKTTKKLVVE